MTDTPGHKDLARSRIPGYEELAGPWRELTSIPKGDLTAAQLDRILSLEAEMDRLFDEWWRANCE